MNIFYTSRYGAFEQVGGDTLHLETIAHQLQALGHQVFLERWPLNGQQPDVIHHFNLGRPELALKAMKQFPKVPFVIQTIFVDFSPTDRTSPLRNFLLGILEEGRIEMLKELARWSKGQRAFPYWRYLFNGHQHTIQKILHHSSLVLSASRVEFSSVSSRFKLTNDKFHLSLPPLRAPFDSSIRFEPQMRTGGICIGRLEPLKNQLALIAAWDTARYGPLHIVGDPSPNHQSYAAKCRKLGLPKGIVFLPHQSPEKLLTLLRTKKVHVLLSSYETTGLATVEALANGCQAVVSDHPIQQEIFNQHVHFANTGASTSIKQAIESALHDESDHSAWAREKFNAASIAAHIEQLYKGLL